jgi:glycopeptide antibiotics resistance protein
VKRFRAPGARILLLLWIGVIAVIVIPWGSFQSHAHWNGIGWIPFLSPPFRVRDIVLNTLLYVPFGYWSVQQRGGSGVWRACGYALALSVAMECTQVFSHRRFPSATDVTTNVLGALWGARWARR